MNRSLQTLLARPAFIIVAGFLPLSCALVSLLLGLMAVFSKTGLQSVVSIDWIVLLGGGLIGLALAAPSAMAVLRLARAQHNGGPRLDVLAAGLEPGDADLIQRLFPNSSEVRLIPLAGGYSGASVLRAQSWGLGAGLQKASVVKVGSAAKLEPEVENFRQYVQEYVGNTASLLHTAQRGGRLALRWNYAAFLGERVQTLEDYAASGKPLAPLITELFSSRSTLGLMLGTARRDPARQLYRDYSWTPRDWQKVQAAARELLGSAAYVPDLTFVDPPVPNPLLLIERWCDPLGGNGERVTQEFDVPVATTHGDLNSRNVLIDERGAIFVIDFAHAGPGHLLRDFARLETELLLVLDQPTDDVTIRQRVHLIDALLHTPDGAPCLTLREMFAERPAPDARMAAVVALRRQAHDLAGPWLNTPAATYQIALLHATLDTLRYAQCTPPVRRTALLVASRLCQMLEPASQTVISK